MTTEPESENQESEEGEFIALRPRETEKAAASAKHYSKRVGWLRIGLPVVAALVLATLVIWPRIHAGKIKALTESSIPNVTIQNLRFTGVDTKKEPYSLSAAKATRPGGWKNVYDLEKPEGESTLAGGAWVAGKADYGRYDQDAHKLWLGGNVQLFHDQGYQFTSDEAQVNLDSNDAWGEKPILIQGNFGIIRGQGFRLIEGGKVIVVKGPASAALDFGAQSASDKPASSGKQP